ncbi:MAG: DegT/DnrJ/EryC1/StrS family aminotransferase [Pseudomonadota bacterium]
MSNLALFGGAPVIDYAFKPYRTIGEEEREAVDRVMRTGELSGFIGAWCDAFNGGPQIQAFEAAWCETFGVRHAVSLNSNTSGLFAAMGAVGVSPGDEVIVPPYTMSATVMAPLIYGGIPVFVDIEPETYCLDVDLVRQAVTSRTRAILVVNLFGHPAALHDLRALADERGIALIEDNAQAPLATERNTLTGTVGHIGVFSLNYHKHFHTGEGGVCTTDDDDLAQRLRLIRNHGENVVDPLSIDDATNLVGFNYRLTELGAAVGLEQLKKADALVAGREAVSLRLSDGVRGLPGLTPPMIRDDCRHVFYHWGARYDESATGVSRETVARALEAEGVPVWQGYVTPLYMLPVFQRRHAIGRDGFPFTLTDREYGRGLCPVAERCHDSELLEFPVCLFDMSEPEIDAVIDAFHKVFENLGELSNRAEELES